MRCFECGSMLELESHHVVPRSLGGTKTVWLCATCHGKVHDVQRCVSVGTLARKALAVKRGRGERTGSVPYGYRLSADGVHLEADEAEQRVVAMVREARTKRLSYRKIGALLTNLGMVPRSGGAWQAMTLARIAKAAGVSP